MESSDQFICFFCGSLSDEYGCPCSTCELCGNDAYYGYDCPSQVPFVYNKDPCFNQNLDNFPQTSPSFPHQYLCCEDCGGPHANFGRMGFQKLLEWNNALLEVILKVELVDLMDVRMRDEGEWVGVETWKAHNIGEMLQEKLEQLSEVERAFVHIDFELSHRPEHKAKV
ncbi:hypothetical protein Tco_1250714 [Tanacetum coccineum]